MSHPCSSPPQAGKPCHLCASGASVVKNSAALFVALGLAVILAALVAAGLGALADCRKKISTARPATGDPASLAASYAGQAHFSTADSACGDTQCASGTRSVARRGFAFATGLVVGPLSPYHSAGACAAPFPCVASQGWDAGRVQAAPGAAPSATREGFSLFAAGCAPLKSPVSPAHARAASRAVRATAGVFGNKPNVKESAARSREPASEMAVSSEHPCPSVQSVVKNV